MIYPSSYTLIHFNAAFSPALDEVAFEAWWEGECRMLSDVFERGSIKPFLQCKSEYKLTGKGRLRYAQIGHWATYPPNREAATRDKTLLEMLFPKLVGARGVVSNLYKVLISSVAPPVWGHNRRW